MLRFMVFIDGVAPSTFDLNSAFLVGSDSVPIRAEFSYADGEISCRKRAAGPSALVLMWDIKGFGRVMQDTVRLPESGQPYILNVELARSRMMRLLQKREDWGLLEIAEAHSVNEKYNEAREFLIGALESMDKPAEAAKLADKCLSIAVPVSEQTSVVHAELLLHRRIQTRSFPRNVFGCYANPEATDEPTRRKLLTVADFVCLPMPWRDLEPEEQKFNYAGTDEWCDFLRRAKMPLVAGPIIRFWEGVIPDWLYIWEHDYETIRGLLYEHIERVVSRWGANVVLWNVISGLHVNSHFSFTFDQIMDLTRMAVSLVKKLAPGTQTMIEITQPWGEYYAKNQRSIPPMIYAEMVVQSGVPFDTYGLQLSFGIPRDGCWQRDLFQISSLLDRFTAYGKPVVITHLTVPGSESEQAAQGGLWRKPWSDQLQARWLEAVSNVLLSKPFIEAICWNGLIDQEKSEIRSDGLFGADMNPKPAFQTWQAMRRTLMAVRQGTAKAPEPPKVGEAPKATEKGAEAPKMVETAKTADPPKTSAPPPKA
ncbi:MAG TPA: endo-1,4-beta-xylanase [Phycisphaerae bacterium]|nr:endo-1,4-beta-xylanase [Phycisphaerae bacterium]